MRFLGFRIFNLEVGFCSLLWTHGFRGYVQSLGPRGEGGDHPNWRFQCLYTTGRRRTVCVCVCGFVFLCAYVRMRVCMYSLLLLR